MNWKEIKEKYPKCYSLAEDNDIQEYRGLFDFFDEHEIFISIDADYYGINAHNPLTYSGNKEDVYFWYNVDWIYEDGIEYKTRIECESAAFLKAFELLEFRLL